MLPLLLLASPAQASVGSIKLTDVQGVDYFFNDDLSTSTTLSASGAASEASFSTSVSATTLSGGLAKAPLGDAFDGYAALIVNGTPYSRNGVATTECGDRQLVYKPQVLGALQVSRKVFVPAEGAFVRWANIVQNLGADTETVHVRLAGDLGSDEATVLMATSSGDRLVTPVDTWAVSMEALPADAVPGDLSTDVRLAHVWQNSLGRTRVDSITFQDRQDELTWDVTFDLPSGATAIVLNYVTATATWAAAQTAAQALVELPAPALSCLTPAEWDAVVNFGVDCTDAVDACNDASFDALIGACVKVATHEGGACDDGTACTVDDRCTLGICDGDPPPEDVGTEVDANCDATVVCYADADADGFRTDEPVASADVDCADEGEATATTPAGDCDDGDASVFPGGTEIARDGVDQDCSGADSTKGCGCDTPDTPKAPMLAALVGATVLSRRRARRP